VSNKNNVIDFSKFDEIKTKASKKKVIQVKAEGEEDISPKELAKRQKVEEEIIRISKRYRKLSKSMRESDSDVQTNIRVLKYCFNMSTRLLPIAEEIYVTYKNERGMYALNALVNQTREIASDIRMLSSNDKTIEYVLQAVFLPSLKLVLQHITNDFSDLKRELGDILPPKKAKAFKLKMNKMLKGQGQLLNDMSKSVEEKVTKHFE